MLRLISSRLSFPRTVTPSSFVGRSVVMQCSKSFSTLQQTYPLRPLPFAATSVSKTLELNHLMFEISQMRIVPPAIAERLQELQEHPEEIRADSVLRKRRLKMKKHKLRKRRKAQRALRKKLKKD